MKKEIFPRAFFGFCVGVTIERFITLLISFGIGQGEFQPVMPFLLDKLPSVRMGALVQTVWCGLIGVTFAEAAMVFELEHWSTLRQYLVHILVTGAVYLPFVTLCYWHVTLGTVLYLMMNILITYGITYFVCYKLDQKSVAEINAELERRNHEQY